MVEVFEKRNIVKFQKKYQDPDGDMITLQSKLDLDEAVKVAKESSNNIVRISLHRPNLKHLVCDEKKDMVIGKLRKLGILNKEISSDDEEKPESRNIRDTIRMCKSRMRRMKFNKEEIGLNCELKSTFLKDVTLPDSSEVCANEKVEKVWRLLNSGEQPWPVGSCLVYISGDKLSADESVIIDREVLPDETIDINFAFTAPSKPGRYISHFRMARPDGQLFGQRIYIDIIVDEKPLKDCELEESKENEETTVEESPKEEEMAPKEYNGVYADQIKILEAMGFTNTEHCLDILESTHGDLSQAIEKLLLWQ